MASKIIKTVFQFRRATESEWEANKTVVPAAGEPCFVTDKNILKIGDGETTFENLEPINGVKVEITGDGKSVVMTNDVFSLVGFDAATIGAHPRKGEDGQLEWIVPSTKDIDDLKSSVSVLQSDVKTLQDVIGAAEGEDPLITRVKSLETKMDGTGDGTVDAKIDAKINEFAGRITENGTIDTIVELVEYVAEHGSEVATITSNISTLHDLVGEVSVKDQIANAIADGNYVSANRVDSLESVVDEISKSYLKEEKAKDVFEQVKYEITSKPVGTLVNYGEKEIRVMCPSDTKWEKQSVGSTGNANMYYMGFKAYAPEGAVSFKEGDRGVIVDEMFTFDSDFAGVDEYGRKYSICWLALASYDEATGKWSYFGKSSSTEKYIGWTYCVEWYDINGIKIASDAIRINLANESCYSEIKPYYIAEVENKIESVAIGNTVLDVVDKKVVIPVGAGLKVSDELNISEDGTLSIGAISFDKVIGGDDEIVMDGGGAV